MGQCGMIPTGAPCFVQLGRFGDLILLFPAFKAIRDRIGKKPVVMVSKDYQTVMEGISYVDTWVVNYGWWEGIPAARELAQARYPRVIVPQFWNDLSNHQDFANKAFKGAIVLQCHGKQWGVDMKKWPSYMASMWDRAGFTQEEMKTLPVVFDRRDVSREEELAKRVIKGPRPILLYNFTGISSPFTFAPEVLAVLRSFNKHFQLINLGEIRARRIYDLLGLYDRAVGMITTDTATLHLAGTGSIPYVAYTVDGWCTSTPKGDYRLHIKYSQARQRLPELRALLENWKNDDSRLVQISHSRPGLQPSPRGGGGNVDYAALAGIPGN